MIWRDEQSDLAAPIRFYAEDVLSAIYKWMLIYVAMGMQTASTFMTIWINGKHRKTKKIPAAIRLDGLRFDGMSMGASPQGKDHGKMGMSSLAAGSTTLERQQIKAMFLAFGATLPGDNDANASETAKPDAKEEPA